MSQTQDTTTTIPSKPSAQLVEQRWVARQQPEVFAYTADFSNSEEWDPGVLSARRIDDGPIGTGSRFELEVKFGTGSIPMVYEITEYEPNNRVVLVGRGEKLTAIDVITFATHDNMTVIDYTADLTFHNYFKYFARFMGSTLDNVGKKALDGLAETLDR